MALRRYHPQVQNELDVGIVPAIDREAIRWLSAVPAPPLPLMQKMKGRMGEWTVAVEGLPTVQVRMERLKMEPGWYVYVLDVVITRREANAVMQEAYKAEVTNWAAKPS